MRHNNLVGTFVVSREVALWMVNNEAGAIVNIASVSGLRGNRGRAAYGASQITNFEFGL